MLSVILPTYNEADNLRVLTPKIKRILHDIPHEIIVVDDDSPDETWKVAYELNVRVKRRRGIRGLASAVVEGFDMAKGDVFVVMDSDGQHDPKLLPDIYKAIEKNVPSPFEGRGSGRGLCIASRYAKGGSVSDWRGYRLLGSRVCTYLARLLCPHGVTDPLSGYFAIDHRTFQSIQKNVKPRGFKILLEILANLPPGTRIAEVPLQFGLRARGKSKLSFTVQWEFFMQYLSLLLRTMRGQFIIFCFIVLIIAVAIIPRIWALRLVYSDADLHERIQKRIEELADTKGWLLSDMSLLNITKESMQILHRSHVRGEDPEECFYVALNSADIQPCNDS